MQTNNLTYKKKIQVKLVSLKDIEQNTNYDANIKQNAFLPFMIKGKISGIRNL